MIKIFYNLIVNKRSQNYKHHNDKYKIIEQTVENIILKNWIPCQVNIKQ